MHKELSKYSNTLFRIKSIMNYNLSKTLTENVIYEQSDSAMDRRTGIEDRNMKAMGLNQYKSSDVKKYREMTDPYFNFEEYLKSYDIHDWFTVVQLILLFLGLFTGGITTVISFSLGGIAGLAEALVYWKEDDPYSAVIIALLSVIPGDEIFKIPGVGNVIKKYGVDGVKNLIRKNKNGIRLNSQEIADLKLIGEKIVGESKLIESLVVKYTKRRILSLLSRRSTKSIMNLLLFLRKTEPIIYISGIPFTFDQLYIYIFRDDIEKMNLRNKNTFVQIIKKVEQKLSVKGAKITTEELLPIFKSMDISEFPSIPYKEDEKINLQPLEKYNK